MIYPVSFCATPKEIKSIKKACHELANSETTEPRLIIETDNSDKIYFSQNVKGRNKTIRLNIENDRGGRAMTTIKKGVDEECRYFFSQQRAVNRVADALDKLKYLLRRAEEREAYTD